MVDIEMSADVEIRITVTGFGKRRTVVAAAVADVLENFGLLEELDATGDGANDKAKQIVFATDGTIAVSQSYEVLPRLANDLKSIAIDGVTLKFETRHDFGDGDTPWVVEVFGAHRP